MLSMIDAARHQRISRTTPKIRMKKVHSNASTPHITPPALGE
jgi:hypothetical protein